ncbi:hypothetical protein T12_801 [Trichinella patagoniensis]|uniref:Uncharacterized protein n=1 Tax=Trichinella patagoniensis TaxID=990121 RepID=A0A0V1AF41_9BILA|nr:hypothetical protein T12_801 [Trichinella patagoniensis]
MDLMSGSLKLRLKVEQAIGVVVEQIYQGSSEEDDEAVALWKSDVS